jgi:hypothetical protein
VRLALTALAVLVLGGCAGPVVPTIGLDLGGVFPERSDWFWRYDNNDFEAGTMSRWINIGPTSPDGEAWETFRIWQGQEQDIIDDYAGDGDLWDLQLYFSEQPDGWYLQGWEANPNGTMTSVGTEYLSSPGAPFAMSNVTGSKQWTATVNEREWTTTATEELDDLEFNGQLLRGVWRLDVETDTGDTPIEGSWWLAGGPGFVQYDLPPFRSDEASPAYWQHVNNDTIDNFLGVDER